MATTRSKASILGVDDNSGIEAAHEVFVNEVTCLEARLSGSFLQTMGTRETERNEWRAVKRIVQAYLDATRSEEVVS